MYSAFCKRIQIIRTFSNFIKICVNNQHVLSFSYLSRVKGKNKVHCWQRDGNTPTLFVHIPHLWRANGGLYCSLSSTVVTYWSHGVKQGQLCHPRDTKVRSLIILLLDIHHISLYTHNCP